MPAVMLLRKAMVAIGTAALFASLVLNLGACDALQSVPPPATATSTLPPTATPTEMAGYIGAGSCPAIQYGYVTPCGPTIIVKAPWYFHWTCDSTQDVNIIITEHNDTTSQSFPTTVACSDSPGDMTFGDDGQVWFSVTARGAWSFIVFEGVP